MGYFPDEPPSWDRFWEYRPFGPGYSLLPTSQSWPYDIGWTLAGAGALASWTRYTGMGVSANTFFGGVFYPTPVTIVGAHAHTSGASPGFVSGFVRQTLPKLAARSPALIGPLLVGGAFYSTYQILDAGMHNISESRPWWLGIVPLPIAGMFGWTE